MITSLPCRTDRRAIARITPALCFTSCGDLPVALLCACRQLLTTFHSRLVHDVSARYHARSLRLVKTAMFAAHVAIALPVLLLTPTCQAGLIRVDLSFQNVSASFNGVSGTQIGEHSFHIVVDDATPDMDPDPGLGAFQAKAVTFTSATLGLFDVPVLNNTYFLTNIGQVALRYDSPSDFFGQFSPFDLPTYMTDINDLSTINRSFYASTSAGQWRTDIGAALPLRLGSGDSFNGGTWNWITSATVSVSSVASVPEIDPSSFANAFALLMGSLSLAERRGHRVLGRMTAASTG